MKIFQHPSLFLAIYKNLLLEPNISFLFFKKLAIWGQNYKYNLQSGCNWNLHGQNWWPDLKFGIANFGRQKDNGTNFKDS